MSVHSLFQPGSRHMWRLGMARMAEVSACLRSILTSRGYCVPMGAVIWEAMAEPAGMVRRVPGAIPRHQLPAGRVSDPGAGPGGRRGPGATTDRLIRIMITIAIGADKVVMRGRAEVTQHRRLTVIARPTNLFFAEAEVVAAPVEPVAEGTGITGTWAAAAAVAAAPEIRAVARYCFPPFVPVEFPGASMPMDWQPGEETGPPRPNRHTVMARDGAVSEEAVRQPVLQRGRAADGVFWLMV